MSKTHTLQGGATRLGCGLDQGYDSETSLEKEPFMGFDYHQLVRPN